MRGLTINNYSILKTSGGELGLFLPFYKLPKYKRIRNVPGEWGGMPKDDFG
jgi:hypothetical protein